MGLQLRHLKMGLHKEMLNLPVHSRHVIAQESDHFVQANNPGLVVGCIKAYLSEDAIN